jgi:hypothetical protein
MREAVLHMLVAALMPPLGAGEEIGTTLNRIIAWTQSILIPMGILTFIIGIAFLMIGGTAGHHRGKTLMVAAVIGVILGFLAGPIVNLAATFAR